MDSKKKETLYSAYDSFLDDKRNTYLSESSYTFDTFNRTSFIEESEYEPIVENQMAIITNEQPKPQRYSMLSALAPLTKRVSLDKPKLTQESQTQDSVKYTDEDSSLYNDYSYVSYESDYEAVDANAQPILQNQLEAKIDEPKGITTKSLEKKIEENIEKYKNENDINTYVSDSDSEIIEEDFSLRFQRDSVRESKDVVTEAVKQKLKEINEKENKTDDKEKKVEDKEKKTDDKDKEKKVDDDNKKEEKKEVKSKGQLEREKAAREAKEIEELKPSYVGTTNIKPVVNELTANMVVDAEKDATEKANESISNIKPQFVGNITIQPNVASLTSSMIKPPTNSIYVSSNEMASLGISLDESSINIKPQMDDEKPQHKDKGKERSESDEEFFKTTEGN